MASTAIAAPSTMPIDAFHGVKEYLALTAKQREWVDTFIETQDAGMATVKAYGGRTSEAYRRMLADRVLNSPHVVAALDVYFQRSDREKFIRDLQSAIANSEGVARIHALRLYGKATGLLPEDAESTPPVQTFSVGQRVTQRDDQGILHVGRVLAIDAEGHATEIRELHERR